MSNKQQVSLSIDRDLYKEFKRYCEQDDQKISHVLEALMKAYLLDDSGVTPTETVEHYRHGQNG